MESSVYPACPRSALSLVARLKRFLLRGVMAFLLVGLFTAAMPAKAQWVVCDPVTEEMTGFTYGQTWMTALQTLNTAVTTGKQLVQAYELAAAIYAFVKDPSALGLVGVLDMTQLPIFNSVSGIDDLRNLATLTDMTYDELSQLFGECATIQRLMNDPSYRASQTRQAMINLMNQAYERERQRKVMIAGAMQNEQRSQKALTAKANKISQDIIICQNIPPVNVAELASYQAQLAAIQIQQEALKENLWYTVKNSLAKKEQDEQIYQANMREAGYQDTNDQCYNAMAIARQLSGITWVNQ